MIDPEEIHGGDTVEESAGIFMRILEGNGTLAMNRVVAVNAGMALRCIYNEKSIEECILIATESLLSGNAKHSFKKLMELK